MSRGNLIFVGGIAAVVAVVVLGYLYILGPGVEAPPAASEEPAVEPGAGQVTDMGGVVEISVGGGGWQAARIGSRVGPTASVRTGEDGSAEVGYGDGLRVEVSPDTQLRVDAYDDEKASFVVEAGLVVADVDPESGRKLRIAAEGTDAVAQTSDGRVHVLADGKGNVQAAVTRGTAEVTAKGKTVKLQTGFQTSVARGEAPATPTELPKSLLLKIKWPPKQSTTKQRHLVLGRTSPHARVRVAGDVIMADRRGRFRTIVQLKEGENRIKAYALDVAGRIQIGASPVLELDTKAPGHTVETGPEMWHQQ